MSKNKETAKVAAGPTAAEVCRRFELSDDAQKVLRDRPRPLDFFNALVEKKLYPDALRFMAYYLPKRKAVWWGCLCLWQIYRPAPSKEASAALEASLAWVKDPTEENRRKAEAAGMAVGTHTPAGNLAMAVFLSGGSISKPDLPKVEPDPDLTAKTVAGTVLLASRQVKPDQAEACRRQFLQTAADVAQGRLSWEQNK